MFTRRLVTALIGAALLSTIVLSPAAAKRPTGPADASEEPLTGDEEAASDAKIAAAEAYIVAADADGSGLSTLSCVSPSSDSPSASPDDSTDACYVPSGYLAVEARDQIKGTYCGPAVGQVIANYSWAVRSGTNRYSQSTIASWMATDTYGGTNAHRLEYGLERGTSGSPRRPSNWDWIITYLRDTDGDGQFGDQLQNYVRANVSGAKMPLAIPVKPHDPNSRYHLSSWPKPVSSVGHWIAVYGWYGYWTGSDFSRIYFTDSSRDEGGSTGKYWNSTISLATMILQHTGRFVW